VKTRLKQVYWAVFFSNGNPAFWSLAWTRREAITSFVGDEDWKPFEKNGCTCRKVRLTLVERGAGK
jgi:hypothetical protein